MTIRCASCETSNSAGHRFCSRCGSPMSPAGGEAVGGHAGPVASISLHTGEAQPAPTFWQRRSTRGKTAIFGAGAVFLFGAINTVSGTPPAAPRSPSERPTLPSPATAEPTGSPATPTLVPTPAPTSIPTPVPTPLPTAVPTPIPTPLPTPVVTADPRSGCDASYPDICIPPAPPDLDCPDIRFRNFTVLPPDPHRFDGDHDGLGCEG